MRLRELVCTSCICVAMAVSVVPAAAAAMHECVPGKPTAESYSWDFKGEVNAIFKDVQSDSQEVLDHADKLQSFVRDPELSWETYADQLESLKVEINDLGTKVCRLETIRRAAAPWQQRTIDQITVTARLMADQVQDAMLFVSDNPSELWLATYRNHLNNLYNEAKSLTHSVGNAVEFSSVSKEYRDLGQKLGVRASS